jgi:hypothetical protein
MAEDTKIILFNSSGSVTVVLDLPTERKLNSSYGGVGFAPCQWFNQK